MIIIVCAALWALLVVGAILFVRHAIAEDRRDFDREDDQPQGLAGGPRKPGDMPWF